MSVRLLSVRFIKHGRHILQSYWKRDIHTNIFEQNQTRTRQRFSAPASSSNVFRSNKTVQAAKNVLQASTSTNVGSGAQSAAQSSIFRFGHHARKLFIDNILNRVTTTYSQELRQRATKKLFYGDSAPFFALVGVSLASGAGVLTKEDELEGVCWEIREAASRIQSSWSYDEISEPISLDAQFNVDKLDIGPPIAKGCAAVVYAAALKNVPQQQQAGDACVQERSATPNIQVGNVAAYGPELMSPMQHMSRFVHNFGGSVDNLNVYNQSIAAATFAAEFTQQQQQHQHEQQQAQQRKILEKTNERFDDAGDGNYRMLSMVDTKACIQRYPLALKMMFNYDIQSNAMCILRAMYKETVPARQRLRVRASVEENAAWERLIQDATVELPPHPNIVCMYGYFCDEVRELPDGQLLYPVAQPPRINPDGYGRNMSLYLLMKRYDYSLRALLDQQELSMRTKLLLFTQLLEAVAHLGRHGVAHRDLKSDNILIELIDNDSTTPLLVLSDFGCCLADRTHGLQLPYASMDVDKGGNAALMAPEIINKQPGPFAMLNYAKADLWACGTIAYEIFGQRNPFYALPRSTEQTVLRNCDYAHHELPSLQENECPALVQQLIFNLLHPNPSKRISPDIAANVMQLFLWAPSKWLRPGVGNMPNSPEILQWLLSLTSKVMCEGRAELNTKSYSQKGRRTYVEYLLLCSFLSRVRLRRVRGALNWMQNVL